MPTAGGELTAEGEPQMQVCGAGWLPVPGGVLGFSAFPASIIWHCVLVPTARSPARCLPTSPPSNCLPHHPQVSPELKAYYDRLLAKYIPQGVLRW